MDSDERLKYEVNLKHENEDAKNIGNIFQVIQQNDEKGELLAQEDLGIIEKGQYKIKLRAFCQYGSSKWSEPATAVKSDDVRILFTFCYFIYSFYKEGLTFMPYQLHGLTNNESM